MTRIRPTDEAAARFGDPAPLKAVALIVAGARGAPDGVCAIGMAM